MIMLILNGIGMLAWVSSALAAAGSCLGHACAGSELNGLAGLIGPHAVLYLPRNTTLLMASRSSVSSNACRTRGSVAIALASLAGSGPAGLPTPLTLPMLIVIP